jgi:serine/threonine protein kinase
VRPDAPVAERYDIESFVRPGRYGDLWEARPRAGGPHVLIKLLRPELFKDGEAIRRFQREVRLQLAFEHPYLLRVLDHGTTPSGDPYLVLEHRAGRPLAEVVARQPLPVERVRTIGTQVARVLAAAAARGIVHRGLGPDAILLGPNDEAWVLDFGLARASLPEEDEPRLTAYGQRLGDPAYMAPEYVEAFHCDARSDLYALGALLYELLTGDPPFLGPAIEVLDAHVFQAPEPPSARIPGVPEWLDALVLALLSKSPADRPDAPSVARSLVAGAYPPPNEPTGPLPRAK